VSDARQDAICDRIMQLLDVGIAALRNGDGDGALMAAMEADKTAKSLAICLPDRSKETHV
jgi:hypothetical protein